MKEFELENERREKEGQSPIETFDEWKKQKEREERESKEANVGRNMASGAAVGDRPKPSGALVNSSEFDDEDKKILDETKKMG